jgi:hypothetical protein
MPDIDTVDFPVQPAPEVTPNRLEYYARDLLEQRESLNLNFGFLRHARKVKAETYRGASEIGNLLDRLNAKGVPPSFEVLVGSERPSILPEIANDVLPVFGAADRQGIAWVRNVLLINGLKEAQTGHDASADNILSTDISAVDVVSFGYAFDGTDWDRIRTVSDASDNLAATTSGNIGTMAKMLGFDGSTYDRLRTVADNADNSAAGNPGHLGVMAKLMAFDGTTYDRVTMGGNTAVTISSGIQGVDTRAVLYAYTGTVLARLISRTESADAATPDTNATALVTMARLTAYNGATFDRLRSHGTDADAEASDTVGALEAAAHLYAYNGASHDRLRTTDDSASTITAGSVGILGVAARSLQYNNGLAAYEHVDNNYESTLLASAARTVATNGSDQNNRNGKGCHLHINISAWTAGSITVTVQGKDPVSGTYYTILTSAALAAVGFITLRVYPGLTPVANLTENDILPRTWRVSVAVSSADSITYSIGNSVIQ